LELNIHALPVASHFVGNKASQPGKDATSLSRLATIPADPTSHAHELASRDVLAMVDDAP